MLGFAPYGFWRLREKVMKRPLATIAAALLFLLSVVGNASADPERRSERVDFAKGATSTVIKG
jgi:hypothetical protein